MSCHTPAVDTQKPVRKEVARYARRALHKLGIKRMRLDSGEFAYMEHGKRPIDYVNDLSGAGAEWKACVKRIQEMDCTF